MRKTKLFLITALFMLTIGFLVACGADGENDATNGTNNDDTESTELEGNVVVDGSGTVYPLMSRIAEDYMINEQPNVSVEVSRSGTSAGFQKFLMEDGTDFNDASRLIKEEEKAKAKELGMEIMQIKMALDGITIVVNPENDWATELTEDQVKGIFLGEYTTWKEINPEWPDEKIQTYGPNENHGTYEFFYENIMEEQELVSDINLQQAYSTLVKLVSEDKNAIGFFGYGYYESNQDKVKAVGIDFGNGPVIPSLDTIAEEGPYANFTRPVFTYLNVKHAKEKPQVLDYALYVANNIIKFAGETGFAPIPEEEAQAQIEELKALK